MVTTGPLLVAQQGETGTFIDWLKKLGLEKFIKRYPVEKLVGWNWLVPQHRVIFPKDFFLSWKNFPNLGTSAPNEFEDYLLLWDSNWSIEPDQGELWPLHPFFHPDNKSAAILVSEGRYMRGTGLPEELEHPRTSRIKQYADFFFHWQAYALIDVVRFADCIEPILHTPDVIERAKGILLIAEHIHQRSTPAEILNAENRWGGLAKVMTWVSHYRSFVDALNNHHVSKSTTHSERLGNFKTGAITLAKILGVTAESLAAEIKDRLLVLAQDWMGGSPRTSKWVNKAWPHLQKDISSATIWLCHLSGRTFESYLLEWRYQDYFGWRQWAQLSDVLPWDFWAERAHFLEIAPEYLGNLGIRLTEEILLSGEAMTRRVDALRNSNYPFNSFLGAFKSLHDQLGPKRLDKADENFRDYRPLDHYALLAIRVEGVLLYAIDQSSPSVTLESPGLETYIVHLAEKKRISTSVIRSFIKNKSQFTTLRKKPDQPIRAIMNMTFDLSSGEIFLVKAFLCCVLARNYFAHHYYLDGEPLLRSKESGFLLGGLIATVLLLA